VTSTAATRSARITVVSAPACHFCEDAQSAIAELARDFAISTQHISIESAEGHALVSRHRPGMSPLVLVDDEYFSAGRLPRKKLLRLLEARGLKQLQPATAANGECCGH
jgi:hypothetical protein